MEQDQLSPGKKKALHFQSYIEQTERWPKEGKHILAQFDEDSIVVYQAYNKGIAKYAVDNKKFSGCPIFSDTRMTWIKTNFLWMMFRCGWGQKDKNQEHILAIWLKRSAFENYLSKAVISTHTDTDGQTEKEWQQQVNNSTIRLQWDPDHSPSGSKHPHRRAIQIGLKGETSFINGDDIIDIQDITEYVNSQNPKDPNSLNTPSEHVYSIADPVIVKRIQLSPYEQKL